jgi:simple sugar transport system permease protein
MAHLELQRKSAFSHPIPALSHILLLGPVLFDQTILTYAAFLLPPLVWIFLCKLRRVGRCALSEKMLSPPRASVGVDVQRICYLATIVGGLLAGLAAAHLSTVALNLFLANMTGRGFWWRLP